MGSLTNTVCEYVCMCVYVFCECNQCFVLCCFFFIARADKTSTFLFVCALCAQSERNAEENNMKLYLFADFTHMSHKHTQQHRIT